MKFLKSLKRRNIIARSKSKRNNVEPMAKTCMNSFYIRFFGYFCTVPVTDAYVRRQTFINYLEFYQSVVLAIYS